MNYFSSLLIAFLCFVLSQPSLAQNVQVCITLNGNPAPVSKTSILCRGTSVTLRSINCASLPETNITYRWRKRNTTTDFTSAIISVVDTGYWVTYIYNNVTLVETSDTIRLVFPPLINIVSFSPNSGTYCPVDPINVTSFTTGPITAYQWYDRSQNTFAPITGATSSSFSFRLNQLALNGGVGVISLIARDVNGCRDTLTSTNFFLNPLAQPVNIGADRGPICVGSSLSFSNTPAAPSGGFSFDFDWYRAGTFIASGNVPNGTNYGSQTITFPVGGQIKVWFRVTPGFSTCTSTDTVIVTVLGAPIVNLGNDTLICFGENLAINPSISGVPPYDYATSGLGWTSSPAGFTSSSPTVSVNPTAATNYTLTVRDALNCGVGSDTKLVNVNPQIAISVSPDVTICRFPLGSTTLTGTASGGTGGLTYEWFPTDSLSTPNLTSTLANPTTTTAYAFRVSDATNCTVNRMVTVTSYIPPIANIPRPIILSETVNNTLNASLPENNGFTFEWTDTDGGVYPLGTSLFREYQGSDTIFYIVTVTNPNNNCTNADTIEVRSISDNTLLYVPNVFSPNATNTENQKLRVFGDNLFEENFNIQIYNKWGNLVYETTDLSEIQTNGWDGGSKVVGTYVYILSGTFKNGKDVKESPFFKGTFNLIE